MADKNKTANALANWKAWVCKAVDRGPAEAARCARFIDGLPSNHPSMSGVGPDERADLSRTLHAAAKGA